MSEKITNGYYSQRTKPLNYNEADAYIFSVEFAKKIPDAEVHVIPNGIITYDGLAIEKGQVRKESIGNTTIREKLKYRYWLKVKLRYQRKKNIPKAISLHGYYWNGYYHWMSEILTRLYVIKDKYKNIPIVLPELKMAYQKETIASFQLDNIIYLKENEYVQPKQLHSVGYIAPPGNYHSDVIKGLAKHLIQHFCNETNSTASKIYISRKKANKRKIVNETEVEILLSEFGYDIYCMEDFNTKEQINICHNAKIIVSLHGAGLTNIMFMPEGSTVFELKFDGDILTNCYFTLASELNHYYYYQLCQIDDNSKSSHDGNIMVNLELFKKNLELIESSNN
jgi:capsular polysaccharide biosynthesis protein